MRGVLGDKQRAIPVPVRTPRAANRRWAQGDPFPPSPRMPAEVHLVPNMTPRAHGRSAFARIVKTISRTYAALDPAKCRKGCDSKHYVNCNCSDGRGICGVCHNPSGRPMPANPSDGHQFRMSQNDHRDSRCSVCHASPDEHSCLACGERMGNHTLAMFIRCAH